MGTIPFTLVLVLAEPSLSVLEFGAGVPEVASPTEGEWSAMSLEEVLMASPGTTVDESPAEVAAGGISPVLVVTPAASLLLLDLTVLSAEGTIAGELTPAVVTVGLLRPSDDELDWSASTPWVLWDCTCVFVCCPVLGGVCEPKVLGPCPPALETDVSDAMLPEV